MSLIYKEKVITRKILYNFREDHSSQMTWVSISALTTLTISNYVSLSANSKKCY